MLLGSLAFPVLLSPPPSVFAKVLMTGRALYGTHATSQRPNGNRGRTYTPFYLSPCINQLPSRGPGP